VRVFVAGATGVVGRPLVRLLVAERHVVAGMTRSPEKADLLRALGAEPVVCDVYDAEGVRRAVAAFAPDVVVDELTDLPDEIERIDPAANARMRIEGHGNVLRAAAGARLLAQSVAWETEGETRRGVEELERTTLEAGGVVLRYGYFYGPGTYSDGGEALPPEPRVHVDEAARQTVAALEAPSGVIVVVDP
jgi:nucleoside-diphosphate-sugar epimerase